VHLKLNIAPIIASVHNESMRTRANVNLDNDAYSAATAYAAAKGLALGAAISELIRRAEQAPTQPSPLLMTTRRGLLVKVKAGRVVTPERVKELSEDDLG
jgi:hypothetical protein